MLVATAILGTALMMASNLIIDSAKYRVGERGELEAQFRRLAEMIVNPVTLRKTLENSGKLASSKPNECFYTCLYGSSRGGNSTCGGTARCVPAWYPLMVFHPKSGSAFAGTTNNDDTNASPTWYRYDVQGRLISASQTPTLNEGAIDAKVEFYPLCQNAAACVRAYAVQIRYTFARGDTVTSLATGKLSKSRLYRFTDFTGTSVVTCSAIAGAYNCPASPITDTGTGTGTGTG